MRLQKLEYYFSALRIDDEECRQRLLCEVARDPPKFSPMSVAFLDEIRSDLHFSLLVQWELVVGNWAPGTSFPFPHYTHTFQVYDHSAPILLLNIIPT